MTIQVRRVRPEEHRTVGDLTVAAYDAHLGVEPDYAASLHDVARRDREAEVWVAADGGAVLGGVTLCPVGSPWREIADDDEGEFRMLAVAPAAQGAGVGRLLAEHVATGFRERGASAVVLSSTPTMTAAHRLYESLGYRRVPERDWAPYPHVPLLAFRLEL